MIRPPQSSRAFTLLEILLALALLGALMLALNQFIFSMGEIWGQNSDRRLFSAHVRACTRHVEKLLRTASLAPAVLSASQDAFTVAEIPLRTGKEPQLIFELPEGDRVLPWPNQPLPDVVCSLDAVPSQGLVLYWHSRHELHFEEDPPRPLVLSPLVSGISYDYFQPDLKVWRNYPDLQKDRENKWQTPDRIRLRFTYRKLTTETTVLVPKSGTALPLF